MLEAARFLHAYATTGSDGKLQMNPANAHERQWAVTNSINDISAMRAFFPAVVAAARVGSTDSLISGLQADIPKLPYLPRTNTSRNQVTTPSSDSINIFAYSTQPTAAGHNVENDHLEPVRPYDLVSDADASLFAVAKRTYNARAYKDANDWSNDAIQAAHLGLASEVPARFSADISKYQVYACGLAAWDTTKLNEPCIEEVGVIATAINEAIATGFDGTIRLAPALPSNWSVSGTVYVQHVQYQNGSLAFGVLEAGSTGTFDVRNPWSGTQATVLDDTGQQVVAPTTGTTLAISAEQGHSCLIQRSSDATPSLVQVTGTPLTNEIWPRGSMRGKGSRPRDARRPTQPSMARPTSIGRRKPLSNATARRWSLSAVRECCASYPRFFRYEPASGRCRTPPRKSRQSSGERRIPSRDGRLARRDRSNGSRRSPDRRPGQCQAG
jgi:hypothetical protein